MNGYNNVQLIGNLTRDPELKHTQSSKAVCGFGLAINEGKGKDGTEYVTFLDCECWEKTAEAVAQYMRKGSPVFVAGRIKIDRWEKDGEKKSKAVIVANVVRFLGGSPGGKNESAPVGKHAPLPEQTGEPLDEGSIPFDLTPPPAPAERLGRALPPDLAPSPHGR